MAFDCVGLIFEKPVAVGNPANGQVGDYPRKPFNKRIVSANSLRDKCPVGHMFGRIVAISGKWFLVDLESGFLETKPALIEIPISRGPWSIRERVPVVLLQSRRILFDGELH